VAEGGCCFWGGGGGVGWTSSLFFWGAAAGLGGGGGWLGRGGGILSLLLGGCGRSGELVLRGGVFGVGGAGGDVGGGCFSSLGRWGVGVGGFWGLGVAAEQGICGLWVVWLLVGGWVVFGWGGCLRSRFLLFVFQRERSKPRSGHALVTSPVFFSLFERPWRNYEPVQKDGWTAPPEPSLWALKRASTLLRPFVPRPPLKVDSRISPLKWTCHRLLSQIISFKPPDPEVGASK